MLAHYSRGSPRRLQDVSINTKKLRQEGKVTSCITSHHASSSECKVLFQLLQLRVPLRAV
jgi:hypothetical protein